MTITALDSVRHSGIIVASDTAEYNQIGEFHPVDATSNPSLVLQAVSKPEYAHLVDEAVRYAQARKSAAGVDERTDLAMDRLLVQVGVQILSLIPGRVSISVDPRLGYDCDAIIQKSRQLISLFEELKIPRERILIKIPATYPGILAAKALESDPRPIHTNMTLIFSTIQALACAQAGASVVSPFIGRVKDWWAAREVKLKGNSDFTNSLPVSQHPGLLLVQQIRAAYASYGHKTQIMAAGFRSADEIVELGRAGARGGPDFVTLPPNLLDDLRKRNGFEAATKKAEAWGNGPERLYVSSRYSEAEEGAAAYARDVAIEMVAADKVPEGLSKFSVDAGILEDLVRRKVKKSGEITAVL